MKKKLSVIIHNFKIRQISRYISIHRLVSESKSRKRRKQMIIFYLSFTKILPREFNYAVTVNTEADLELLQHPRWSTL